MMIQMMRRACFFFIVMLFPAAAFARDYYSEAMKIVSVMDDATLAAQVIMTGVDGKKSLGRVMGGLLTAVPAGAIMLFKYNLDTPKDDARNFIGECAAAITKKSGVAPFAAVDHEGGGVHRFGPGVERLPAAAHWAERAHTIGEAASLAELEAAAFRSGEEIHGMGVNLNLAPVVEAAAGGFLGGRSFGADPRFCAAASAAFIRGMARSGVGCAAKHFPGSAAADPHVSQSVLSGGADTLALPFAELLRAGGGSQPLAIMVSHSLVPAADPDRIASLSPPVMNGWLRNRLGFSGFVIADDFTMAAASTRKRTEAETFTDTAASLAAGADMVMAWPKNLLGTHREILAALADGRLSRERLREAAARVVAAKIKLGLIKERS